MVAGEAGIAGDGVDLGGVFLVKVGFEICVGDALFAGGDFVPVVSAHLIGFGLGLLVGLREGCVIWLSSF